jgi:WD40 repeat protein
MFMNKITYVSILLFFAAVSGIFSQRILPSPPPPSPPQPVEGMHPLDMIVSSDGKRIAVYYQADSFNTYNIVWDIENQKIQGRIPLRLSNFQRNTSPPARAFSPDGSIRAEGVGRVLNLYNNENNGLIKQFVVLEEFVSPNFRDPLTGFSTLMGPMPEEFEKIFFSPDGKKIIVISTPRSRIKYVDTVQGSAILLEENPYRPILDLNIFQGKAVIRGKSDVIIYNLFTGRKEGEIPLNYNNMVLDAISFSLNDDKNKNSVLLAIDRSNGNYSNERYLFVCDMEKQKILYGRKIENSGAYKIRLTGRENIVALSCENSICLYNYQTGTEIARLVAYEEPLAPMAPSMPARARTIQVGGSLSFVNASRLMNDITREGFFPYLEPYRQNNSVIWSVLINVWEEQIPSVFGLLQSIGYTNILLLN